MKKNRAEKGGIPISLSSKRASLNHQQLFVPYKIDWKGTPLQSVDNNGSKHFFQNMKAELSNIKNDFEKLIRKEISLKNQREDSQKNKPKCMSAYKRNSDKNIQEFQQADQFVPDDHFKKIINIDRQLPCSADKTVKSSLGKDATMKTSKAFDSAEGNYHSLINQKAIDEKLLLQIIESKQAAEDRKFFMDEKKVEQKRITDDKKLLVEQKIKIQQKDAQLFRQNEWIGRIKEQSQQYKKQVALLKMESDKYLTENDLLNNKIKELTKEISGKNHYIGQQTVRVSQQQKRIAEQQAKINNQERLIEMQHNNLYEKQNKLKLMDEQINRLKNQINRLCEGNNIVAQYEMAFQNERAALNDKINELLFHNQNAVNINQQLYHQNQMLKQNCNNLQRYAEDLKRRCSEIELDCRRKLEYLQNDISEYEKRQDMFTKQIDHLTAKLNNTSIQIPQSENEVINNLVSQNNDMRQQIAHLQKQVQVEKAIHQSLSKKYQEEVANLNFEQVGQSFEIKINQLIEENYALKNKLAHNQSQFETLNIQRKSLEEEIRHYQRIESERGKGRQLTCGQWQTMNDKIEALEQQLKTKSEQFELLMLKRQVENQSQVKMESFQKNSELLLALSNQLASNETLQSQIKKCEETNKVQQIQIETLETTIKCLKEELQWADLSGNGSEDLQKIKKQHNELYKQIQRKTEQLNNAKAVILQVLVQKLNKREDEDEMDYYLREIESRLS